MKERAVFLFLLAMGTIKVYENFAYDDEREEDDNGEYDTPPKHKVGKRSIDEAVERWIMNHDFKEELIETNQDFSVARGRIECSSLPEKECSCRRLNCFGQRGCRRDLPGTPAGQFLECRSAILSGLPLCECKKYVPLEPDTYKSRPSEMFRT